MSEGCQKARNASGVFVRDAIRKMFYKYEGTEKISDDISFAKILSPSWDSDFDSRTIIFCTFSTSDCNKLMNEI